MFHGNKPQVPGALVLWVVSGIIDLSEFSNTGATFSIVSSSSWGTKEVFVQEHWISLNSRIMKHLVFRNSRTTFMIVLSAVGTSVNHLFRNIGAQCMIVPLNSRNIKALCIQEHGWSTITVAVPLNSRNIKALCIQEHVVHLNSCCRQQLEQKKITSQDLWSSI